MLILRCTKSLLKVMGTKPLPAEEVVPETPVQEWYGNLLWLKRKKCVLFTSAGTLFSFLVPAVTTAQLRAPGELFREHLDRVLEWEGMPGEMAALLRSTLSGEVRVTGTCDRRVLGSMNDIVRCLGSALLRHGDQGWEGLPEEAVWINTMPLSLIDYDHGSRRMKAELARLGGGGTAEGANMPPE